MGAVGAEVLPTEGGAASTPAAAGQATAEEAADFRESVRASR